MGYSLLACSATAQVASWYSQCVPAVLLQAANLYIATSSRDGRGHLSIRTVEDLSKLLLVLMRFSLTGEIACGYASGCLSQKQTLEVAYHRGRLPVTHGLKGGLMVATGLSAAEAVARLEGTNCVLACDNSCSSTTLSGKHMRSNSYMQLNKLQPFHNPSS